MYLFTLYLFILTGVCIHMGECSADEKLDTKMKHGIDKGSEDASAPFHQIRGVGNQFILSDQRALNAILRSYSDPNDGTSLKPGTPNNNGSEPLAVDHFLEVHYFVDLLMPQIDRVKKTPLDQILELAKYINDPANLFVIDARLNRQKANWRMEAYPLHAEMVEYYESKILNTQVTVLDSVTELANRIRRHPTGSLLAAIGNRVLSDLQRFP